MKEPHHPRVPPKIPEETPQERWSPGMTSRETQAKPHHRQLVIPQTTHQVRKKKKNVLRKDTVLTENPRFLVHCRPRPQSGTTTNRLLGGCLETVPRRRHWPGRGTADGPTRVVEENGARNGEYQPTLSQYRPRHQPQELPRTHLERTHRPRPKK